MMQLESIMRKWQSILQEKGALINLKFDKECLNQL
jgi:hypothetical protein